MQGYTYRRRLQREEWARVVGIGVGAGIGGALLAGYLARVLMQRTPLDEPRFAVPAPLEPIPPSR